MDKPPWRALCLAYHSYCKIQSCQDTQANDFPLFVGSDEVAGNWGLLDQVAALTWVQNHIGAFGGDPQRVTLASDRGGADVASIHLLTTRTTRLQLFRRALLMVSGTACFQYSLSDLPDFGD